MRYLAICILSLVTYMTTGTSPSEGNEIHAAVAQASYGDSALMILLGGALVALQLRRRQKSLRWPRPFG